MRPRRTPTTNVVFALPGGNEDNDLHARYVEAEDGQACIESVWTLDEDERLAIADGANIVLRTFGTLHPPVALYVTDEQPGREARPGERRQ